MKAFPIALGSLGLGVLGLTASGYYAYRQAFYAKGSKKNIRGYFEKNVSLQLANDEMEKMIADVESCPYKEMRIKSHDGLTLFARYYHICDNAPLQILIHGYKGNAERDMCGAHMLARKLNHNILLIDQRGCGKSEGSTVAFGVLERHDTLSWIKYASAQFGNAPIFLLGVSMGGAVALMTTDMDLPSNVKGVIADCPYSSPEDIVKKVCRDRGMPDLIYPAVTIGARLFGKFNICGEGAVKSVKNSKVPILILHGEKDGFVPVEMAQKIYDAANCEKYICFFEGADHCASYMSNPKKYETAVRDFTSKCLESARQ